MTETTAESPANKDLVASIKETIEFLDSLMVVKPSKQIAYASNLLKDLLKELES